GKQALNLCFTSSPGVPDVLCCIQDPLVPGAAGYADILASGAGVAARLEATSPDTGDLRCARAADPGAQRLYEPRLCRAGAARAAVRAPCPTRRGHRHLRAGRCDG